MPIEKTISGSHQALIVRLASSVPITTALIPQVVYLIKTIEITKLTNASKIDLYLISQYVPYALMKFKLEYLRLDTKKLKTIKKDNVGERMKRLPTQNWINERKNSAMAIDMKKET